MQLTITCKMHATQAKRNNLKFNVVCIKALCKCILLYQENFRREKKERSEEEKSYCWRKGGPAWWFPMASGNLQRACGSGGSFCAIARVRNCHHFVFEEALVHSWGCFGWHCHDNSCCHGHGHGQGHGQGCSAEAPWNAFCPQILKHERQFPTPIHNL